MYVVCMSMTILPWLEWSYVNPGFCWSDFHLFQSFSLHSPPQFFYYWFSLSRKGSNCVIIPPLMETKIIMSLLSYPSFQRYLNPTAISNRLFLLHLSPSLSPIPKKVPHLFNTSQSKVNQGEETGRRWREIQWRRVKKGMV